MKTLKFSSLSALLLLVVMCGSSCSRTEETKPAADAKPYPLDTCLVCGMKLAGMGEPYVFVYNGQQIKVCDIGEKADFDKDPAKYLKKLEGGAKPQM